MSERQLSLFPHLRVSSGILARLGEELNPNADHGLLELVKNAYDADARSCTIELVDTDQPGGEVHISDDGDGMDDGQIEEDWLVLGSSRKSIEQPTRLGRLPVGNKGLGRLAALRLGTKCCLTTRPRERRRSEYHLDIDWDDFERARTIEEVKLEVQSDRRAPRARSGTEIVLSGLRAPIGRMDVTRLARGILLLADPFKDSTTGFSPTLKAPEFKDLEALVRRRYFADSEFHLDAKLDDEGRAKATIKDYQGKVLFQGEHADLAGKQPNALYECPATRFNLWAFILDKKTFGTRRTTQAEVKEWLGQFGGVHLYIRGVRAAPYGDPGHDWLDMNLKRARSPELRPSTNTSIGRITLDDPEKLLQEKTDRTGIEGHAFRELKRFATDALDWMARERMRERESRRRAERTAAPRKTQASKEKVAEAIAKLPKKAREDVGAAVEKYDRAREKETTALQKEVQLYRTLGTVGITAAVFAHESTNPIQRITRNANQVKRHGEEKLGKTYSDVLSAPVERILSQADALRAFSGLTLSQIDHEKRRTSRVDIHETIKNVCSMFAQIMERRKIGPPVLQFDQGEPYLRASEAAVESIVTNLVTNSLKALGEGATSKPKMVVQTEIAQGSLTIRVFDNGPGIQGLSMKDIWLPGETTYPNGTGLGLTIVRDSVADLGGSVDAIQQGVLGGAELIVELPILGA